MKKQKMLLTFLLIGTLLFAGCSTEGKDVQKTNVTKTEKEPTKKTEAVLSVTPAATSTEAPTAVPTEPATVTPIPPDTTAPELTVSGEEYTKVIARSEFLPFTYEAFDDTDGELTERVITTGEVNINYCDTYELQYEVTDTAGNQTTVIRTVEVVQPETVMPEEKTIYLTFDDGPGTYTNQVLELLDQYDIKGTFFVCGYKKRDILKKIYEAGHSIGAHCRSHEYDEVYASDEAYFEDLEACLQGIYESTGAHTTLIRFPGGSSNTVSRFQPGIMTRLTAEVEKRGYQYFDWNVSSGDCGSKDTDELFENLKKGVKGKTASVCLNHPEARQYSVDALKKFIPWAIENGYTFKPLDPTSPRCHHKIAN